MRVISPTLETAQISGAADPHISININSVSYTSRLISLTHVEEQYRSVAIIALANSDHHFYETNLLGQAFTIGYGYVTTVGTEFLGDGWNEGIHTLEVKNQSLVSMEGQLVCLLYCEGGWGKLREFNFISSEKDFPKPYLNIKFKSTDTIYELIDKVLTEAGYSLNALGTQDDGIVNGDFRPTITINSEDFESPAYLLSRLIEMTKCYLREVDNKTFEVIYPQLSDSIDETYYNNQAPYFKEYVEKKNLLIPNHVVVFANKNPDPLIGWDDSTITGHARDPDQFTGDTYTGNYEEVIDYILAPFISSQTDANNRAEAILTRHKSNVLAGRLVLPFHDCRVELYDRVLIRDTRGS